AAVVEPDSRRRRGIRGRGAPRQTPGARVERERGSRDDSAARARGRRHHDRPAIAASRRSAGARPSAARLTLVLPSDPGSAHIPLPDRADWYGPDEHLRWLTRRTVGESVWPVAESA